MRYGHRTAKVSGSVGGGMSEPGLRLFTVLRNQPLCSTVQISELGLTPVACGAWWEEFSGPFSPGVA